MKATFLVDEPKVTIKLELQPNCLLDWSSARSALGLTHPTMRQYRRIIASSSNPDFIGVKQIERLAKCVAWCNYGRATQQTNLFSRRNFRHLELRKALDNELVKYGIDWVPIWNQLARVVLAVNL